MVSVRKALGDKFSGVLIEDEVLEPYFITAGGSSNGYTLSVKRESKDGDLKYRDVGYFMNLSECLNRVVREKMHENSQTLTLREYIDEWRETSKMISTECKDLGV